jgi:hypothetical protein
MTTYTNPYTGATINPSQVGYETLTLSTSTFLEWPINGTTNSGNVVANILEISATAAGVNVHLPSAQQVSNGQAFIIRNIGSAGNYSFNVTDITGNNIVTIPVAPTTATVNTYYIYLTDNSTNNGTWANIAMGIGTSSASASTLAGYGLTAINNTLNESTPVTLVSSTYSFKAADLASLFVWTGGAGILTLPSAPSVINGWYVFIKNDGTGIVNIAAQGTSTIDGSSSTLQIQLGGTTAITTDGMNWYTYALSTASTFNYTQLYLTITGGTTTLTAVQAKNVVQEYAGTLTSNATIILPPTVQIYALRNITAGSYSLTFGTGSGTTLVLPQNQTVIAICDGTNVYNANSASSSSINALTLGNGSATNPSLSFVGDATTGLFLAASGQLGFATAGINAGELTANGLYLPVGINAGAF